MTHTELVQRAVKWLKGTAKCPIAFAEFVTVSPVWQYHPDAIGWRLQRWSVLVECKTSRGDFFADRKKPIHFDAERLPGQQRWYLTPPGLVRVAELPDGWGLLECHAGHVALVHPAAEAPFSESRAASELPLLLSAIRRVNLGVNWDEDAGRFQSIAAQDAERRAAQLAKLVGLEE